MIDFTVQQEIFLKYITLTKIWLYENLARRENKLFFKTRRIVTVIQVKETQLMFIKQYTVLTTTPNLKTDTTKHNKRSNSRESHVIQFLYETKQEILK